VYSVNRSPGCLHIKRVKRVRFFACPVCAEMFRDEGVCLAHLFYCDEKREGRITREAVRGFYEIEGCD
jgi:hypothetical protein